jgi:hypothetical protein
MGSHLRAPGYVVCQCELYHFLETILTKYRLDMRSTRFTHVKIGSVPYPANCASGYATETTCMAYFVANITFAGALTAVFLLPCYSFGPLAKNTLAVPYVLRQEYVKLIQFRNPSNLRSPEGTKRPNTQR